MDVLQSMFTTAQQQFSAQVDEIGDRWQAPTPDTEWDVAALVDHLIDEQRWVAPLLSGHDLDAAQQIVERMQRVDAGGINRVREWQDAARTARDAVLETGALEGTVNLSRGVTPAREYLTEMVFDLTVHAWDLGRALGSELSLPEDLADYVYSAIQAYGDLSATGLFAAPVAVPDDAPTVARLVAATGRNPA